MSAPLPLSLKVFRAVCWLGVAIWVSTVFYLSSRGGAELTENFPFIIKAWDKFLHFIAFFCGALPLVPALRLSTAWSWEKIRWCAAGLISLYGALDEVHQLWTPSRSGGDPGDWLADTLGALAGAALAVFIHMKSGQTAVKINDTSACTMRRLLIATKNAHKTAEIRAMLGDGWTVEDLTSHPEIPAPEENGATFDDNARIKAEAASQIFPGLVLSDDSGLEVDPLDGAPGVQSARYSGTHGDDAANRARLLRELAGKPQPWRARFRCAMALAESGCTMAASDGSVEGRIIDRERGEGGFGYDALFVPEGFEETFAELPASVKNQLSHRARAMEKMIRSITR